MLLEDEAHVIQWLSQYGALPKTQLLRMLQKTPAIAEKILSRMKRELQIADVGDGYYLGLDPLSQPDQKTVLAVWVLLRFIDFVEPLAHYPASFPSQLFFLKENTGYEIVVLYEGEGNLLRLLQPQEDLKYIIVVPRIAMAQDLRLPRAPCLFATVEFQGLEEPEVLFYSEETIHNGMGPDDYHLVVYDSNSGTLMASVYDKSTETLGTYTVHKSARDGAAVMMALFPVLVSDDEFKDTCSKYHDQYTAGFPDLNVASEYMGILCDNAYRRIKDDGCPAHIKVNLDRSGNIMRVGQAQLDSGALSPARVVAGEFTIFAKTGAVTYKKAAATVDPLDFVGKYRLHPRTLSPLEQLQVPKLPSWYIIPQEIVQICRHAQETTGKPTQMRNFLLRGPAGTGKTMGAKAVAAGLGLPYKKYTCNANTEIYDLLGQLFPDSAASSTGDAELDRENEELKAMGGPSYANMAKLMNLPDLDDLDYDPAGVYQALTGLEKDDATAQDCMALILDRVTAKVQALSRREQSSHVTGGQTFTYTQTDFLDALKNGYVIELQEPTTIAQPGVMVGLNSLLEQSGSITLPTGEIIERHPDAVVIITTNISYEGCRGMNQSIIDRMSLVQDIELPAPEVMVQRAMSVTGATDEYQVSQMVQVVNDMSDYCRNNSITDGSVGMRSLLDWIVSAEITGDPYQSALYTVISKATADEADREALISTVLEPIFAPKARRATA